VTVDDRIPVDLFGAWLGWAVGGWWGFVDGLDLGACVGWMVVRDRGLERACAHFYQQLHRPSAAGGRAPAAAVALAAVQGGAQGDGRVPGAAPQSAASGL